MHNKYRRRVAKGNEKRGKRGPQPGASDMKKLVRHPKPKPNILILIDRPLIAVDMEQ